MFTLSASQSSPSRAASYGINPPSTIRRLISLAFSLSLSLASLFVKPPTSLTSTCGECTVSSADINYNFKLGDNPHNAFFARKAADGMTGHDCWPAIWINVHIQSSPERRSSVLRCCNSDFVNPRIPQCSGHQHSLNLSVVKCDPYESWDFSLANICMTL